MPRGFSHSGRSGGGSSRGGGFSGGSSRGYSGGSSGGSYTPRPRRPWHIPMFGRTVVISTGVQSVLATLLVFVVFAGFVFFAMCGIIGDQKSEIKECKEDIAYIEQLDARYKTIIQNAKLNDSTDNYFITTGTFADRIFTDYDDDPTTPGVYNAYFRNSQYWYFVVYTYEVDGVTKTDSTFTQFTRYVYDDNQGVLEIAYQKVGKEYWAINTDYADAGLEGNVDYLVLKDELARRQESLGTTRLIAVGSGVVLAGLVLILVLVVVKQVKKAKKKEELDTQKAEAEIAHARANADMAEKKASQIARVCEYCGMSVPDGEESCPACGSRKFK